jgi:hypothetical protein
MYLRKIIHIRAEDSPNVRLGIAEKAAGLDPTHEALVPGVLSYREYCLRRATWDPIMQCVGLDGQFYKGAAVLMFPSLWLNLSATRAGELKGKKRVAKALGVDPAEGGDDTSFCVIDELGIIKLESEKTPDTTVVTGKTIAYIKEFNLEPEQVIFDRGGGGRQHADRLRKQGYDVQDVGFGTSPSMEPSPYTKMWDSKVDEHRDRYVYKNRRAQLYHNLRALIDPAVTDPIFAIPAELRELRRQLAPIPLQYDEEGRIWLPPKHKKDKNDKRQTLEELIGRSPDDADALVLAVFGMQGEFEAVDVSGGWF